MSDKQNLDAIEQEIAAATRLPVYNRFTQLWHIFLRLSLAEKPKDEFDRVKAMVKRLSKEAVLSILSNPGVDALLNLHPPLETVLTDVHENLEPLGTLKSVTILRTKRTEAPREALLALGLLLKNIRNKLEHGFKTPYGLRDNEILSAASSVAVVLASECLKMRRAIARVTTPSVTQMGGRTS